MKQAFPLRLRAGDPHKQTKTSGQRSRLERGGGVACKSTILGGFLKECTSKLSGADSGLSTAASPGTGTVDTPMFC